MAARMAPRFRELTDVDWASFEDGEVATYDSGTDSLTGEPGGGDASVDLATHAADTTNVHGIVDTTVLASDAELAAHIADTTFIHGVSNTSDLATDAEVASAVSTHSSDTTSVHGITDTTVLATDAEVASAVATHESDTSVHGIADTTALATDAEVTAAVSAHESDTTVHGVDTANVPSSDQKAALAGTSGTPSVSNRFVTEDDPGLGGADLADAVVLAPGTAVRNLIEPTADHAALVLKGDPTQTNPIQMWWDSDETSVAWLSVNGRTFAVEIADGADASGVYLTADPASGTYIGVYGPDGGAADLANWLALWSDSTNRHEVTFDGAHKWSDGTAATDTTLERTAPGELSVNGEPIVLDDDARLTGGVDQGDIDTTVATHSADTTSVHGIADTSALATDSEVATAVSDHSADTTSVHGIADTAALATASSVSTAVSNHEADTTSVHGIADTSALATLPIAEANVTGLTAALAAKQPLDSDLTSIAALTTTSYGRSLLEAADASGAQTTLGVSTFIKTLLDDTTAAAARTTLGATSSNVAPISGKYYGAVQGNTTATAGSMVQSRVIYTPVWVDGTTTFDRIGIEVDTLVASLVYRLGIYNYSLTTGYPGTLVLDAGTVDGATTGIKLATISWTPAAGWYYFACVPQAVAIGAAKIYQVNLFTSGGQYPIPQANFRGDSMLYAAGVTGALPDPAGAVSTTANYVPNVMLRVA